MTPESSKKLNPRIVKILHSGNHEMIVSAVQELREEGNPAYLPLLFELLHSTTSRSVKKSITGLLAEIKQKEIIPMFVEAIQNKQYTEELQSIVSACWENGLDYSEYLPVFVDLVIEKEFLVAFEAYTVIMNMTGKISNAIKEAESKKIREALRSVNTNKTDLLQDLLEFLPELEEGIEPEF